jgi:ArsR family transcriptional regulator, arsenate/arsenite/antimonite-responsive transcriptional repressor
MIQIFSDSGAALPGPNVMNIVAFARICKALGHPARVRIVEHLQSMDQCICGKIVDILPLAQSTVSQHLKCLKNAGLIQGNVDGPRTCYCLNKDVLERFRQAVDRLSL